MKNSKRVLGNFAKNYKIDFDSVLLTLWDYQGKEGKFDYLKNEKSIIKNKDFRFVQETILKLKYGDKKEADFIGRETPKAKIIRDHDFSSIGKKVEDIHYISEEEILKIHEELESDFSNFSDPISPPGLKDSNLLNSALFHAATSYEGHSKYPTIETAGAALMYALSHNHTFHNGNKRTAIVALLVFLDRHNVCLTCDEDELFRTSLKLADHKLVPEESLYADAEIYRLAQWIHSNSTGIEKGERPITLKKLKHILFDFNCTILDNGRVERRIKKENFWRSEDTLVSKKIISTILSDGRMVDRRLIKSLREDLRLTPEYGIDSKAFYDKAAFSSSDFILKYKNLLRRLSKL